MRNCLTCRQLQFEHAGVGCLFKGMLIIANNNAPFPQRLPRDLPNLRHRRVAMQCDETELKWSFFVIYNLPQSQNQLCTNSLAENSWKNEPVLRKIFSGHVKKIIHLRINSELMIIKRRLWELENSIGIKAKIKEKGCQACELNDNVAKSSIVYKFSYPQNWKGWYQSLCGNVKDLDRSRQCWVEKSRRPMKLSLPHPKTSLQPGNLDR